MPTPDSSKPTAFPPTPGQKRTGLAAVLILLAAGLFTLGGFLPALVWAVIFAIGLWPTFQRAAERWPRHRHVLLPAGMVLAVMLIFVIPIIMVAIPLLHDSHDAALWIAQARKTGVPPPPLLYNLPSGNRLAALWQGEFGRPGQLSGLASHVMQGGLVATGRAVATEALHRVVLLLFMLLTLFFLLAEGDEIAKQVRVASSRAFGPQGEVVGLQMIRSVHGTVNGLVLVGLAEGVLLGLAYWIAGVPHPALFGLATVLLAMVPFGAAVAFCLAAMLLLALGYPVAAAIIVAIGLAVTFVADHFVRPVLIGGATRLPFL